MVRRPPRSTLFPYPTLCRSIASHIALSVLMAMFPFLILVMSLASFFGTGSLADEAADIILEAWPSEVGEPIANEVHRILTEEDRKSTRLNSSHANISYAVFC